MEAIGTRTDLGLAQKEGASKLIEDLINQAATAYSVTPISEFCSNFYCNDTINPCSLLALKFQIFKLQISCLFPELE